MAGQRKSWTIHRDDDSTWSCPNDPHQYKAVRIVTETRNPTKESDAKFAAVLKSSLPKFELEAISIQGTDETSESWGSLVTPTTTFESILGAINGTLFEFEASSIRPRCIESTLFKNLLPTLRTLSLAVDDPVDYYPISWGDRTDISIPHLTSLELCWFDWNIFIMRKFFNKHPSIREFRFRGRILRYKHIMFSDSLLRYFGPDRFNKCSIWVYLHPDCPDQRMDYEAGLATNHTENESLEYKEVEEDAEERKQEEAERKDMSDKELEQWAMAHAQWSWRKSTD